MEVMKVLEGEEKEGGRGNVKRNYGWKYVKF